MKRRSTWEDYYKRVSQRAPHPVLMIALENIETSGLAYDMGAGSGIDSKFLISKGWKVIAVDKEKKSSYFIRKIISSESISLICTEFESLRMKKNNLIFGGNSFPFCSPQNFNIFWKKMYNSLERGGVLAGNLFGHKDDWATNDRMTFFTNDELLSLFDGFDILYFDEFEDDKETALGDMKHWHIYHFVLEKT